MRLFEVNGADIDAKNKHMDRVTRNNEEIDSNEVSIAAALASGRSRPMTETAKPTSVDG